MAPAILFLLLGNALDAHGTAPEPHRHGLMFPKCNINPQPLPYNENSPSIRMAIRLHQQRAHRLNVWIILHVFWLLAIDTGRQIPTIKNTGVQNPEPKNLMSGKTLFAREARVATGTFNQDSSQQVGFE